MMDWRTVVDNLKDALLSLAIYCYSPDKSIQSHVEEIAQVISDTIDFLTVSEGKKDGGDS